MLDNVKLDDYRPISAPATTLIATLEERLGHTLADEPGKCSVSIDETISPFEASASGRNRDDSRLTYAKSVTSRTGVIDASD